MEQEEEKTGQAGAEQKEQKKQEKKLIGRACYLYPAPEPSLVSTDGGEPVHLTKTEYDILSVLIENRGDKVSLETLAQNVWGVNGKCYEYKSRRDAPNLRCHISRIRKKLDRIRPGLGDCIKATRGWETYTFWPELAGGESRYEHDKAGLVTDFTRGSADAKKVFALPDHFISPQKKITSQLENAFKDSNFHVISGPRGMGKTELARYFARRCCDKPDTWKGPKYKNVIFTVYSKQGLEHTIASLRCRGSSAEEESYSTKIGLLKDIEKPCLLVIDNYDNEKDWYSDLSMKSDVYLKLLDTGCHVLFTSTIDMNGSSCIRQTKISLPPEKDRTAGKKKRSEDLFLLDEDGLIKLFCELSQDLDPKEDRENIRKLIRRYLLCNTYLVILAAKLTDTRTLDDILSAFQDKRIRYIYDHVSAEKDGKIQRPSSIMDHFKVMYDLASVQKDEQILLSNLSLLPLEGMKYDRFFGFSFEPGETEMMTEVYDRLRNRSWVFMRDKTVFLHPLVKEMMIEELSGRGLADVAKLVHSIAVSIDVNSYMPRVQDDLKVAVAAYEVCHEVYKKRGINTMTVTHVACVAMLASNIALNYDLLKNAELAYKYGKDALEFLDYVNRSGEAPDPAALAAGYNKVGYAILHAYKKADSQELAEYALNTALQLIEGIRAAGRSDTDTDVLYTKIQGNLGALYLTKGDCDKALALHRAAKDFREELLDKEPTAENKLLLAAAHKGIATDQYHSSKQKEPSEAIGLLESSLSSHREAVKLYEEVQTGAHLDTVIANNRLSGTMARLLELAGPGMDAESAGALSRELIERMGAAAEYLCSIPPITSEMEICMGNVSKLAEVMAKNKTLYDKDMMDGAVRIAEQVTLAGRGQTKELQRCCEEIRHASAMFDQGGCANER